jgi:hypothetical protein
MEIVVKLVRMVFEVGRNSQDHLRKRDFAACRGAHGKFRFEKRFKVHDGRYSAKAYRSLFHLLRGVFGIGGRMLTLNYFG